MLSRLKINSKAVMSKTLVKMIIILLVFIVLAAALVYIISTITAKSDREVCRASVLSQSIAITVPGGEKLVTPDCKTYNVVFFDDHVEINGKAIKVFDERANDFTKKFNGLTDQIVNKVLAEEMRGCWYQFLEGNRRLFNSGGVIKVSTNVPYQCFLCAEVRFDDSISQAQFADFYNYLQEKEMSGTQMTYYEYLIDSPRICESYEGLICWEEYFKDEIAKPTGWETPSNIVFSKDQDYSLIFIKRGQSAVLKAVDINPLDKNSVKENYVAYIVPRLKIFNFCTTMMRGSST